jgi:hypothetical protein
MDFSIFEIADVLGAGGKEVGASSVLAIARHALRVQGRKRQEEDCEKKKASLHRRWTVDGGRWIAGQWTLDCGSLNQKTSFPRAQVQRPVSYSLMSNLPTLAKHQKYVSGDILQDCNKKS